jgi:hypothetical protein
VVLDPVDTFFLSGPGCRELSNPSVRSCLARGYLSGSWNQQVKHRSVSLITSGFPSIQMHPPLMDTVTVTAMLYQFVTAFGL